MAEFRKYADEQKPEAVEVEPNIKTV